MSDLIVCTYCLEDISDTVRFTVDWGSGDPEDKSDFCNEDCCRAFVENHYEPIGNSEILDYGVINE